VNEFATQVVGGVVVADDYGIAGRYKTAGSKAVVGQMTDGERAALEAELTGIKPINERGSFLADIADDGERSFAGLKLNADNDALAPLDEIGNAGAEAWAIQAGSVSLGVGLQLDAADRAIESGSGNFDQRLKATLAREAVDAYQQDGYIRVKGVLTEAPGHKGHMDEARLSADIERITGVTVAEGYVSAVNRSWAQSSQSGPSLAMQLEVGARRGDKITQINDAQPAMSKYLNKNNVPESMAWIHNTPMKNALRLRELTPASVSATASGTERQTAAVLKAVGLSPTDTVTLYRGAKSGTISYDFVGGGDTLKSTAVTNPLSSWSEDRATAESFAGSSGGSVIQVSVPVSQIYGVSSWSGNGSLREREIVLYDDPKDFADFSAERAEKQPEAVNLDEFGADWIKQVGEGDIAYLSELRVADPHDVDVRHASHNQKTHGRPGGFDVSRGGKQGKEFGSRSPMIGDMTEAGEALAMQVMSGMPGMGGVMTKEAAVVEVEARLQATIDEALARGFSADRALASAQWYDVANDYSAGLSDEFGFTHPETGAAVLATLSPSAAWEGNVRNGRELMKKVGENKPITDADVELALGRKVSKIEASLSRGGIPDKRKAELEEALSKLKDPAVLADAKGRMVGKKFNDADPDDQVAVLNGHIQGNAMRGISLVPNKDGTYTVEDYASKTTVQSNAIVKKAIKIAIADKNGASADEMTDIISKNVSQESKVRAFYQNIANPNDTIQSAVTLDTHAFSGAFSPVNAVTSKVLFASSRDIGYAKTYPIVRESMASLAPKLSAQLGASEVMSPRAVQSVTWEMTRFLYPMSGKGRVLKGLGPGEYFTTPDIDAAYASGNHQRAVSLLATAMGGPTG
jgi:hypothetical protein